MAVNNANKKVLFKSCAPFADCITEINNAQKEDAYKIDIVMSMYNLIEYSDAYLKTSESLWKHYRDKAALANGNTIDFPANNNNSVFFKIKLQSTGQSGNGGTEGVEIMVPLKYLN